MHTCRVKAHCVCVRERERQRKRRSKRAGDKNATGDGERVVTERH